MARRGGAEGAPSLRDEIRDLGPPDPSPRSESTFSDPLRAESPEPSAAPSAPPRPAPGVTPPVTPGDHRGADEAPFDARGEITRLQDEIRQRDLRDQHFQRELALRMAGAQPVGAPSGEPQVDPVLQEGLDILQVTEDDLLQVFQGGQQGAQIVSRALQAVYLLAVQATERRLINYYNQDQGNRATQGYIAQRSDQMRNAFWESYPDLAPHALIVNHFAAEVAREQAAAPRFDWDSAQKEVARRSIEHLRGTYNLSIDPTGTGSAGAAAYPPAAGGFANVPGGVPPRPTLQSRLRPVVGEMGGGASRGVTGNGAQRTALTSEIMDLGRR